jgi:hypothetical protein
MGRAIRANADSVMLLALACGATSEMAAAKAGVSQRTCTSRLATPEFRQRLAQLKSDIMQRAADNISAAAGEAVRTLMELQDKKQRPMIRLRASTAILEIGIKLREATDLEQRLLALEQRINENAWAEGLAEQKNGNGVLMP